MDRSRTLLPSRREAIVRIGQAAAALLATALTVPGLRFLLNPILEEPVPRAGWTDLGPESAFGPGITPVVLARRGRFLVFPTTRRMPVFLQRRASGPLRVLSGVCTHRGCAVDWMPERGQFLCPCHDGAYDAEGRVLAGPPPRPLDELPVRVTAGRLQVKAD